ncbi:DUF2768 domain-containing protein [Bacillaceae bacterium Marseille-Q3522]|nr:DUF2768 domain-containing protein [Bacillaceae bacterium Marseille-Q3522]
MTPALMKMWIAISAMVFMFLAIFMIYISRYKMRNNILRFFSAAIAYFFMAISGIIIFIIVFSGPTADS